MMITTQDAIASAIRTITTERTGIDALASALENGLGDPFRQAVERIGRITGRVIVTGVGKSGHIASKIAATLASTGTPAYFVHPAEANHGDLGMIARDDAIIALSWSGESRELGGILEYSRRFQIPLIALTSGDNSALARGADVVLALPKSDEACPHGLAPTTSTMMQLVMGDALAVALLESRGFTANDFRDFHPGGKLGASLTLIADIMHTTERLPLVPLSSGMREAIIEISQKGFGCVGVIDNTGQLAGIVTDGDIRRHIHKDLLSMTVDDVMTVDPITIAPDTLAASALKTINQLSITALMVLEDGKPVGIVHLHDLLRIGVA
ncbi:MAG: KpsF/GutQ family sugar-phosphate isomerase [Pseudomonadota bacterium]